MAKELAEKAKEAFLDDDFDVAVDLYSKAIDLDSSCAAFFADRAQAFIKLANFTEAVGDANKAIVLEPTLAKAYLRKGNACMKLEEYSTAKEALEKGASISPYESKFKKMINECDIHIAEEGKNLVPPVPPSFSSSSTTTPLAVSTETDVPPIPSPAAPAKPMFRHEFYQKPEEVVVTIFAKGIPKEKVTVEFGEQILSVVIDVAGEEAYHLQPRLFGKIIPEKCRYEVLSTKVEIRLAKAEIITWASLEYGKGQGVRPKPNVSSAVMQRPVYPSSKPAKDWDKLEALEKDEKLDADAAMNEFFRDIYSSADEDMRRAMNKSFAESNGSVLLTNLKDVGTKKVESTPPDGMELKNWKIERPLAVDRGENTVGVTTGSDALKYLKAVKDKLQDNEKYETFLELLKDCKDQGVDNSGVIARAKDLFKGHEDLFLGFNALLWTECQTTLLPKDENPVEFLPKVEGPWTYQKTQAVQPNANMQLQSEYHPSSVTDPSRQAHSSTSGCPTKRKVDRSLDGVHIQDALQDYDVVIRYERGDLSINNFVSHLRASLCRRGISVYEEFNEVDAIPECRLLIILLTSTYVPWNLLNILEQQQHTENQVIYPIFYGLSPYDFVCNSKNYERFFLQDEPERWLASLKELTQMPGYTLTDKSESNLIDEMVRDALEVLCSGDKVNMSGMHMQVEEILSLLCIDSLDVRSIGIWGMVGIGKTTISEAIFGRISAQYETSVFLKDLHTQVKEKGVDAVREEFFSKVLEVGPHLIRISDIKTSFFRSRLQRKRVFVVLDDVNDYKDVETCLGTLNYFGPGSRIIMTSRNRRVFELCKLNHVYEVKPLDIPKSLQLLDRGTFQTVLSPEISLELVKYANGNPQVLQFLSSSVGRADRLSKEDQHSFPIYIPHVFERSCCGLDDNEMGIFLDMACFFRRMNKDNVAMLLDGCGFFAHVGFRSLVDKSLLIISHNMVDMLTFIRATGREIVRRESSDRPGERSRLWNAEDIRDVFVDDTGTSAIEGIFLDMSELKFDANPNIFEKMCNLRLLKLYWSKEETKNGVSFPQGLEYLPRKLRLLHWEHYPLSSLPRSFNPENLVELNLSSSCVTKLWKGKKNLEKLRKMRLSFSNQLTKIPRLSTATNLEHIDLEGCNSLLRISQSISCLKKLAFLNLKDCSKLESIPSTVDLESLEFLNLSGCSKLENFPEISPNLKELYMGGTMIQEIPSSIKDLVLLEKLDLENSKHLKNLPTSICKLKHLETLNLSGCTNLDRFPDLSRKMRSLRFLDLSRTAIQELPSSIYLIALEELRFVDCRNLVKLPDRA